ncbi:MAG TPA: hypothetical protein VJB94_02340 [Candidatus Nanoarchaeia archaeon]|nr:hypothetical protein [Candidatus Nanoarchaeia archaeon]
MKEGFLLKTFLIFLILLRVAGLTINLLSQNEYKIYLVSNIVIGVYLASIVLILAHREWGSLLLMGASMFEMSLIIQNQLDGTGLAIIEVFLFTFAYRLYSQEYNFHKT